MKISAEIVPPNAEQLARAAALLVAGELVAFPTETVYGLGANALDDAAAAKIFAAKGRPSSNPLIVHLPSSSAIERVALLHDPRIRNRFERLAPLWPGPLSIVLPAAKAVSRLVTAGGETVAIRVPRHPVARELLERCRTPIAAPSANQSGYVSPTTAQHVFDSLGESLTMIIDGGPCSIGLESTVLSIIGARPRLYRRGAIGAADIERRLGEEIELAPIATGASTGRPQPSPGLLAEHYAPHTPIAFFKSELLRSLEPCDAAERIGLITIAPRPDLSARPDRVVRWLSASGNLDQAAAGLFAVIRELDQLGLKQILIERCEEIGIGEAIMDRLRRASARSSNKS